MNINRKIKLDFLLLFFSTALLFHFFITKLIVAESFGINPDKFRDYMFLSEVFNGRIILHGATSGIENVLHGVLGYWILYPFVIVKDYISMRILIVMVNFLALLFFIFWAYKKFSGVFILAVVLYIYYFFPTHFIAPSHLAFVMAFYCALFYFLMRNNLFGVFACTFFLFHFDVTNWILFFPYMFVCLKRGNKKYFYSGLFLTVYFLMYITRMNYGNIFNLSFIHWIPSRESYSLFNVTQVVLPFLWVVVWIFYRIKKKSIDIFDHPLFDYLFVFFVFYCLVALILNAKISYFVMPVSVLIGYTAHIFFQFFPKIRLRFFIIFLVIGLTIYQINFPNLLLKINTTHKKISKQNLDIPIKYFLKKTYAEDTDRFGNCKSGVYEVLLSLKFNNSHTNLKNDYLLLAKGIKTDLGTKTNKDNIKKDVKFKDTRHKLYFITPKEFKKKEYILSYIPLQVCLHKGMRYLFYDLKKKKCKLVGLEESYLHFNGIENLY